MKRRELLRYASYTAGFAVSAPVLSAFFTSCESDPGIKDTAYAPKFFSAAEYAFITKFAGTMLPTDDTPGALDVGVPQIMDKMVSEVYGEEAQGMTRKGIAALMGKMEGFADMDDAKALTYLQEQDEYYKTFKAEVKMSGEDVPTEEAADMEAASAKDAYFTLKSGIISAYFNTEEVATTMLAYDPVPGEYIPCGDLQELTGGKAWAL
ncbi:MAG: gluconate 2-dehydrogenase subunit 3 family protein [Bacteroidota bacterium]